MTWSPDQMYVNEWVNNHGWQDSEVEQLFLVTGKHLLMTYELYFQSQIMIIIIPAPKIERPLCATVISQKTIFLNYSQQLILDAVC